MGLFRLALTAGFLVAGLTGCTYSNPASEAGSARTDSPAPSTGELGLTSQDLIELGRLDESGSQRVDMDIRLWSSLPSPVRSVVIYNYAERIAYGTANLTDQ